MKTAETAEIEVLDLETELQVFDPVAAQIAEVKEKNANLVFDYEDKQGNKEARSWIAYLRKLKAPVNEVRKMQKAEAKKLVDACDTRARDLLGHIEEMIEVHHKPIWEIQQREDKIEAERLLKIQQEKEAEEAARQAELEAKQAELDAKEAELHAKQEELERKERERQIAETAKKEEAARREKFSANLLAQAAERREAAEVKAAQAAVDAENRRIADIQREKDRATAEAVEKERLIMEEKRIALEKKEQEEFEETQRINDEKHRSNVHRDIYKSVLLIHVPGVEAMTKDLATATTKALIDGKIPHTQIIY